MPGLLGNGWNDPQSAAIMALSGNMVRGDFGGGLLDASSAYQGMQESLIKRQLMQQELQQHGIALQQAQQQWNIMGPAMQRWADQSGQGQSGQGQSWQGQPMPSTSQPAIAPSAGGALGSGSPMGGQSASAPQTQGSPAGGDKFSLGNVINGAMIGRFGGPGAETAYWASQALPDSVKTNNYYGMDPSAVQAGMQRELAAKGQTNVRSGSTLTMTNPNGSISPLFTAPDTKQNANITWDRNGNPQASQIPGLVAGIQSVAKAQQSGKGSAIPYSGVDKNGNPLPVTNETDAATQGQGGPWTPQSGAAGDIAGLQREIARTPGMMATPAQKQERLAILNQELVKAQAILSQPAQATQPAAAPAASPGAIYAAPPMGAVTNANTAQDASAKAMHDSYTRMQANGATVQGATEAIDKMLDLGSKKWPVTAGAVATNQDFMNPEAAEYGKQRANLTALLAAQGGTNGTDAGRALTGDSIPDYGKPKPAIADGLGTIRNQIQMVPLKRNFLTPSFQSGDSKAYTTLENQFDQNISPSMVPLLTMPRGPAFAAALAAARKNPVMEKRLTWAAENGLLK